MNRGTLASLLVGSAVVVTAGALTIPGAITADQAREATFASSSPSAAPVPEGVASTDTPALASTEATTKGVQEPHTPSVTVRTVTATAVPTVSTARTVRRVVDVPASSSKATPTASATPRTPPTSSSTPAVVKPSPVPCPVTLWWNTRGTEARPTRPAGCSGPFVICPQYRVADIPVTQACLALGGDKERPDPSPSTTPAP